MLDEQASVLKEIVAETGKPEAEVKKYYDTFWERFEVRFVSAIIAIVRACMRACTPPVP